MPAHPAPAPARFAVVGSPVAHSLSPVLHRTAYAELGIEQGWRLGSRGALLIETARMWASLGFFGKDGLFHIHGVTGPDEYTAVVNDNLYTNVMARFNLRAAAALDHPHRHLDQQPPPGGRLALAQHVAAPPVPEVPPPGLALQRLRG